MKEARKPHINLLANHIGEYILFTVGSNGDKKLYGGILAGIDKKEKYFSLDGMHVFDPLNEDYARRKGEEHNKEYGGRLFHLFPPPGWSCVDSISKGTMQEKGDYESLDSIAEDSAPNPEEDPEPPECPQRSYL